MLEAPKPSAQETDAQSRPTALPALQQPPQTPLVGPGDPSTWWKRVGNVKNLNIKIGTPRPKPPASGASSSKKAEASKADNSKSANSQGKPVETAKSDAAKAAKPKTKVPEHPALVDLSDWPIPVLPSIDIIAVHDLGQTLETAWAYIPEKAPPKRPAALSKQPYITANAPTLTANASLPGSAGDPTAFKAGLRALQDATKERVGREPRGLTHIAGWTAGVAPVETSARDLEAKALEQAVFSPAAPDLMRDDEVLVGDPSAELMDKGKGRADGDQRTTTRVVSTARDGERGGQLGNQPRAEQPTAHETGENKPAPDDEDRVSRHSNRPSSTKGSKAPSSRKGSKAPSEKDKVLKPGGWLTDKTMLASDLDRARVLAFTYKTLQSTPPTDSSIKKPDYDKHLKDVTDALLTKVKAERMDGSSKVPLILMGTGFGCLIIQRLTALLAESEAGSKILDMIAGIFFFDAPNTAPKEQLKTEGGKTGTILPPPANSSRTARMKAILDTKAINTEDTWRRFHSVMEKKKLSTVWFYPSQRVRTHGLTALDSSFDVMLTNGLVGCFTPRSGHRLCCDGRGAD
jgi:hypothetical protein